MASCRSCGAAIEWATSETTGKPVPLDVAPAPKGNLALVAGKAHRYGDEDAKVHRERRVSHFATCPQADSWRSKSS